MGCVTVSEGRMLDLGGAANALALDAVSHNLPAQPRYALDFTAHNHRETSGPEAPAHSLAHVRHRATSASGSGRTHRCAIAALVVDRRSRYL
jgi:hypothetical protein